MNFQTEMKAINIQVLESVLYNIEKDIPLIKITLQFDDVQKYQRFINKIAPIPNQDEDILSNSDSDSSVDDIQQKNQSTNTQQSSIIEHKYVEKLSQLELSIILKENYQEKIEQISKQTGVKILIVPQKLKFFGPSDDDIAQAKSLVHEIKTNIIISSLSTFGKQAYESNYIRQKLNKQGIKLGKISQKYYYWFDDSLCNRQFVQNVIEDIFQRNVHISHPLVQNYQLLKRQFNKKYIDALVKANVKLYQQYLQSQLNEDKNNDHKIELNMDRTETIIHVRVLQQAQLLKQGLKNFYSQLIQFFIHFKTDQKMNEIQIVLNERGIMWCKYDDIFVITFNKKNTYKANESISNLSIMISPQTRQKEFLENLLEVFQLNSNCYIEYLEQQPLSEEQIEQKSKNFKKKISIQHKKMDGLVVITPKNRKPQLFVQIVGTLVLRPRLYPQKQKIQKSMIQIQNKTISGSSIIHNTTSQIQQSQNEMSINQDDKNIIIGSFNKNKDQSILGEIRQNLIFKQYKFFIKDIKGINKYDDIDQLKKGKGKFKNCQQLQKQLEAVTKRKFKPYQVIVPEKYKAKLYQSDDIITVFMRDSDKLYLDKDEVFVYLLTDEKKLISTNGWLLNINKSKIRQNGYRLEAPNGTFEIILYLKFIEQAF